MRVLDLLVFLGIIKSLERKEARRRAMEWLERFDLTEWSRRPLEELSKWMQQKVQFIATVQHDPDLVILDELFSGLDPINVALLKDIMLEMKDQKKILIFSTHQMEEAERLCDRICLINRGKKILDGRLSEIKADHGKNRVVIAFDGDDSFLDDTGLIRRSDNYGNYVEVEMQPGRDKKELS